MDWNIALYCAAGIGFCIEADSFVESLPRVFLLSIIGANIFG